MRPDGSDVLKWHGKYPLSEFIKYANKVHERFVPCWTVGRLIEIYRQFVFSVELFGTLVLNDDIIETIVSSMEVSANKCNIDFSKLED